MKIILGLLLVLCFVVNSFGSPLVFKDEVNAIKNQFVDFKVFDASKYKRLRVNVVTGSPISKSTIVISGGEGEDRVVITTDEFTFSCSHIIDLPPTKINVRLRSEGSCQLYIYAE